MTQELSATLPTSWADVPLLPYSRLAAARTLAGRADALAALVSVDADVLRRNVRLYADIMADLDWLDQAPPEEGAQDEFRHLGKTYVFVGNLDTIDCGQFEALTELLSAHAENPAEAGPGLLAVLYKRKGGEQTAEAVEAATRAFETLPVAVAWPILGRFTTSGWRFAQAFHSYSALRAQVETMLSTLEANLPPSTGARPFFSKPLPWLTARWIQSVRGTL